MGKTGDAMKKKEYHYFISFNGVHEDDTTTFGSVAIDRCRPITGWPDIEELKEFIITENSDWNLKSIVILNFRQFDRE
jgi:hypothetical protein